MGRKRFLGITTLIILGVMLSGCTGLLAKPTATPTATNKPQPTATSTVTPTPTKTSTPTATPTEEVAFMRSYEVAEGGYRFELPSDEALLALSVSISGVETLIEDMWGEMEIYIASGHVDYGLEIDREIEGLAESVGDDEVEIDPEPFEVDGHQARRAIITTVYEGADFISEFILIDGGNDWLILINPSLLGESLEDRWEEEVLPLREVVLDSFQIFEPVLAALPGACAISEDPTYGYSEDNPVQVGGDWLEGPSRERAYLDNLRGPNGEMISYERVTSVDVGDTILDEYQITYTGLGSPILIYLDMYSYSDLYAPVGFTCSGPFNSTEP